MAENGIAAALSAIEFDSPSHVTPLFRSLAETIPSPQFSESRQPQPQPPFSFSRAFSFLSSASPSSSSSSSSPVSTPQPSPSSPPPCSLSLEDEQTLARVSKPFDPNVLYSGFLGFRSLLLPQPTNLVSRSPSLARIDSHNKILYARHADQRKTTFQRVLETGGEFECDVRAMLLRANILKHEYNHRQLRKP
ncbi:hypothetical protein Droror1_Dr00016839 [Drosera rotundifolia]